MGEVCDGCIAPEDCREQCARARMVLAPEEVVVAAAALNAPANPTFDDTRAAHILRVLAGLR